METARPQKQPIVVTLGLLGLLPLVACGGGGGGTSDGGGTGGQQLPPAVVGDKCDEVDETGWKVACVVNSVVHEGNQSTLLANLDDCPSGSCGLLLPHVFPTASACCEGSADVVTVDAECQDVCQRAACQRAEAVHSNIRNESCPLGGSTGFDYQGCLTGTPTGHVFDCSFWCGSLGVCNNTYTLEVECDAVSNETYSPEGWFSFINDGNPDNDRDVCTSSEALSFDPDEDFGLKDSAQEKRLS